jgi:hypothetical protein
MKLKRKWKSNESQLRKIPFKFEKLFDSLIKYKKQPAISNATKIFLHDSLNFSLL